MDWRATTIVRNIVGSAVLVMLCTAPVSGSAQTLVTVPAEEVYANAYVNENPYRYKNPDVVCARVAARLNAGINPFYEHTNAHAKVDPVLGLGCGHDLVVLRLGTGYPVGTVLTDQFAQNWIQEEAACECGFGAPDRVSSPTGTYYQCARPAGALSCKQNECPRGNPVLPGTGIKLETHTDYQASVESLSYRRHYRYASDVTSDTSTVGYIGRLGYNWHDSFDRSISRRTTNGLGPADVVTASRPEGHVVQFQKHAGSWVADGDIGHSLTELTDAGGSTIGYELRLAADDAVEQYDASGRLLAIRTRAGRVVSLAYSDAATPRSVAPTRGLVISAADDFGRTLSFTYDALARLTGMTDPDGRVFVYAYDAFNNLTSVTYPDGATTSYLYEDLSKPTALTGIIDENGNRYATFGYDAQGRATLSEHAGGADRYTFSYSGLQTTETDPSGAVRTYSYDNVLGALKVSGTSQPCPTCGGGLFSSATYDANGNPASRNDFNGNLSCTAYDPLRNLETQRVEGLSGSACPGAPTPATRTITTDWDATFRLPARIAEPKRITTFAYDSRGNLTSRSVQATTDPTGAAGFAATATGLARTWTYSHTYHPTISGFIVQTVMDGPRTDVSDTTTYAYDAVSGSLASVTNALGHVTTLGDYDAHGRPRQIVDPNGLQTTLAYDLRGRLISRNVGGEVTSYEYDGVGQVTRVTNPDGSYIAYSYDAAHRLTGIEDNLGNRIAYTLDAAGNRIQEQTSDPGNVLTQTRSRVYDTLNRLVQDIGADPATEITAYRYDAQGNLTSIVDALNRTTTQTFDALNRLVTMVDPKNGQTGYGYDGLDQIASVTDPRTLVTRYATDGLGNVTQLASPDTGTAASAYDTAGNVVSSLDAAGVQVAYAYDALNRLTSAVYTGPAGSGFANTAITYNYDQGTYGVGRLSSVADVTGSSAYQYDQKGRLVQEVRMIGGVSYTTGYQYDSAGRLVGMIYPGGRQLTYTLDALGRVSQIDTSVNGAPATVIYGTTYRPFGQPAYFAFGNGQLYARAFDLNGRVSGYSLGGGQNETLAYDPAGRITTLTNSATSSVPTLFGYDELDRLTGYTQGTTSWSYAYDANGNRTNLTIGSNSFPYSVSATSNQLLSSAGPGATSYAYTAAGNLAQTVSATYSYDARHRLIGVSSGATSVAYQVNALGQRVQKVPSGGPATVYHYDSGGRLIAESDAAGTVKTSYVWLDDQPVGVISAGAGSGACNVSAPQVDPGTSFAPFNSLTRLEVRSGRPTNGNGQWRLGTNTQKPSGFAKAYLNWVSGRVYDFTLSYDGKGAGTYTVSHAGTKQFTRTWAKGLQVGNALQFYAKTSAGIGAGNVVSVELTSINGTPVTSTLQTAGNNLFSESRLTYLIPARPNGFSLTGRIAFTFTGSAPPKGSRMNFLVTAGNVTCQSTAEALYYVSADHLNTPRSVADSAGHEVWRWSGEPFGSAPANGNPSGLGEFTFNLRFPGQYFDQETGRHYNYFRDYDPQIGRYVQSDPIGLAGGTNLYGYVGSKPTRFVDSYGLDVGEPGFEESFIPFWGSGRQAINDFQTGHYVWGSVNSVVALSDVALVGYGVKALCKGAWKLGSHTWGATRKWYGKTRELAPNTPVHHWAIPQGGWGKHVPDIVKNQPWNLNPMPDWGTHANIHGYGPDPYNAVGRWWYGTPDWAKIGEGSLAGKAANSLRDDECNCAQ